MAFPKLTAPVRPHRRQDLRFPFELPVTLTSTRPAVEVVTWDVSYRGLFVKIRRALPARQLVRFRLVHPQSGQEMVLHGMVAVAVGPDDHEGRPQGMGIELFAVDPQTRRAWWKLVDFARDHRRGGPAEEAEQQSGVRVLSDDEVEECE